MADLKPETIEPDPSSTGIANDSLTNTNSVLQTSDPTADAASKTESHMPSADEVDKAIAEVEARKQEKETSKETPVESNGHEVSEEQPKLADAEKEPSKRVQEARNYNNRDRNRDRDQGRDGRPRKSFKENYKSDLTSQKESSDPVAIRKQVKRSIQLRETIVTKLRTRSNSTSPTRIYYRMNSSLKKSKATRTCLSQLVPFTHSSACAISSLSLPLWRPSKRVQPLM